MTTALASLLNELPANGAVIAQDGTILDINDPWRRFAEDNGLDDGVFGLGTNYLSVCSSCSTDPFAEEARQALAAVLDGRLDRFAFTYPCHSENERRWFFCLFLAIRDGAVVLHFNHLQQMDGHRLMREATARIRELCDEDLAAVPPMGVPANDDVRVAAQHN